jgi:hypothetical protein
MAHFQPSAASPHLAHSMVACAVIVGSFLLSARGSASMLGGDPPQRQQRPDHEDHRGQVDQPQVAEGVEVVGVVGRSATAKPRTGAATAPAPLPWLSWQLTSFTSQRRSDGHGHCGQGAMQ